MLSNIIIGLFTYETFKLTCQEKENSYFFRSDYVNPKYIYIYICKKIYMIRPNLIARGFQVKQENLVNKQIIN